VIVTVQHAAERGIAAAWGDRPGPLAPLVL
jgi:hypothetical protein